MRKTILIPFFILRLCSNYFHKHAHRFVIMQYFILHTHINRIGGTRIHCIMFIFKFCINMPLIIYYIKPFIWDFPTIACILE